MIMEDDKLVNKNEEFKGDIDSNVEEEKPEDTGSDALKKINALEEEVRSLKDTLLRKVAESENLRKRLEKEKDDVEKYANTKFARDFLSVIDNFDRVSENSKNITEKINTDNMLKVFFDGVVLCGKELLGVFKKHGITIIEVSEGDSFNPQYHQAMCEVESDEHDQGVIIKVFQHGYLYRDRLLRPTMVSVSKKT